ncbi:hypothetical protein F383_37600 [Gossypium arboreum]|uniref:Uncharacterized protein n=1 Tax=Gossypium arboreum TaxID=29729 RepID=A0A0B0M848_GOSAR|nr:hypothetical protein F383_37600 [Gossypium arboreum]
MVLLTDINQNPMS